MKREPLVYSVLLVAALALAFRSWTHEDRSEFVQGKIELWQGQPDAIDSLEYFEPGHHLVLRRAGPEKARYLWATEDTTDFRLDAGAAQRLLEALAAPRAELDLGAPDARARSAYGLDSSRTRLLVHFRNGSRELVLGTSTVDRSGDRYALERSSGHAYILPALQLPPLTDAAQLLVEHRLHAFAPDSVATANVRTAGQTLAVRRIPAKGAANGPPAPARWVPVAGGAHADTAFPSFMMNVEAAATASYAAREDARTMTPVVRVAYADTRGRSLGFFELFQRPGNGGKSEYFARTELTGTLVRLYPGIGDNLADAVAKGL